MARVLVALLCFALAFEGAAITALADVRGLVTVAGKPAGNVVVWVDGPVLARVPGPKPVLDQRNLNFFPRVLAVQTGTEVEFPNHDRVFHNVFSFHNGKKFDLGLYPTGAVKQITFDTPGLSRLFCNIHPHMAAYIMAVPTQYFAVSDETGQFSIPNLPHGTYVYHVWRAGKAETTGTAVMNATTRLDIQQP